jgi:hypothetical protein
MRKERGQEGCIHLVLVRTVEIDVQFSPRLFIDVFQCLPTKGKLIGDVLMNRQHAANHMLCFPFSNFFCKMH